MEKFERETAVAAPLLHDNVNTDVIIRIERLLGTTRQSLGRWCFEAFRYLPDGSENPDFVLNRPGYRNAAILLAGPNFGCGSSREGAVWALQGLGIRCVIAPSFGEIFLGNCFQNGLLPVILRDVDIRAIAAEVEPNPENKPITIDLIKRQVESPSGRQFEFGIAPVRREALLRGLDTVELTLARENEIGSLQAADRKIRPWIYETLEQE